MVRPKLAPGSTGTARHDDNEEQSVPPAGWGYVMMAVGVFFLTCGSTRSEFVLYRLFVVRSRMLWGDNVHRFFQFLGVGFIILGGLRAAGL